jgi:3-oxoacyl-[acyl-carrier protein] reductase
MTLTGKTAIVTGGSRGIGRAIVRRLADAGARVVFTHTGTRLADAYPGTQPIVADQSDLAHLAVLFDQVRDSGLDILVNNAAISSQTPIADLTTEEVDRVLTVNFTFALLAIREAAPLLRDGGRIVNLSSLNTVIPGPGLALYCASKAALEQVTAVAARELGPRGITVNTVSPGATDTDMLRATNPPEALGRTAALTALQRLGEPDDVAAVVAFLAGPDARWITGQNLRATGGLLI